MMTRRRNKNEPDEGREPVLLASRSTHTTTNTHNSIPATYVTHRLPVCLHPGTRRIIFKSSSHTCLFVLLPASRSSPAAPAPTHRVLQLQSQNGELNRRARAGG